MLALFGMLDDIAHIAVVYDHSCVVYACSYNAVVCKS